jgi:hypothetical protein
MYSNFIPSGFTRDEVKVLNKLGTLFGYENVGIFSELDSSRSRFNTRSPEILLNHLSKTFTYLSELHENCSGIFLKSNPSARILENIVQRYEASINELLVHIENRYDSLSLSYRIKNVARNYQSSVPSLIRWRCADKELVEISKNILELVVKDPHSEKYAELIFYAQLAINELCRDLKQLEEAVFNLAYNGVVDPYDYQLNIFGMLRTSAEMEISMYPMCTFSAEITNFLIQEHSDLLSRVYQECRKTSGDIGDCEYFIDLTQVSFRELKLDFDLLARVCFAISQFNGSFRRCNSEYASLLKKQEIIMGSWQFQFKQIGMMINI